jgi:hypothetical protein
VKNFLFSPASRTSSHPGVISTIRATLIFALITLVSCLTFHVSAQNSTPPAKTSESSTFTAFTEGGAFVIQQGANGEMVCRNATPAEARIIRSGGEYGLRQINHLKDQVSTPSSGVAPAAGLTIMLRATPQLDQNPTAKAAFVAAAAKWESLIKDSITIVIDVDFGTTAFGNPFPNSNILGVTGTQQIFFAGNYPDLRTRLINHASSPQETSLYNALPAGSLPTDLGNADTILVASPLYRALGAINPIADPPNESNLGPVPRIGFNSAFGFDFDPSDGISSNLTDFDAVAVHEIGHALGFNSEVGDKALHPSDPLFASVWDIFRFRPSTANLNNFSTAQRILSAGGVHVQFNGGPELGLSTADTNGNNGDGNQASHWKDDLNNTANYIGIMDPLIADGRREVMTANDQSAIDSFGYTITPTNPPPNDNFANAQGLSGSSGTANGTNIFATRETGEPTNPPNTGGGRSVWYNWTAPGTGQATFDTNGSTYDTTLAIYTGSAVNALTVIASNDDISPLNDPPPRNIQSLVNFNATAGTTYRIQVDGFNGDQGSIVLHWTAPGAPPPGPNTVQFNVSSASATETANATTKVDLLVTRTGDTAQAAAVDYATSNATASDRSDYLAALGTLHFAAFETSKIIPVFIVNDSYGETAETFNIALSNPVACTLGSPGAMVITINSNEAVDGPNPVRDVSFDSDFFVRQHYVDFFNREADAGGLAFWKDQIDSCPTQACRDIRKINVSAAFFLSIEFQQTGYLVERLYKVAYGDAVGTSTLGGTHLFSVPIVRLNEFLSDTQQIGRGVVIGAPGADQLLEANKQALIAEFVQRSRFTNTYPLSMSPGQFVNELSARAGPGVVSPAERNQLVSDLTSGAKTRAQVLRAVAEDPDLFASESNRAFVLAQYFGYLRRNPNDAPDSDYTGYDFWLGKLNQFSGNFVNAEMVKAFIVSGEYQGRFGP